MYCVFAMLSFSVTLRGSCHISILFSLFVASCAIYMWKCRGLRCIFTTLIYLVSVLAIALVFALVIQISIKTNCSRKLQFITQRNCDNRLSCIIFVIISQVVTSINFPTRLNFTARVTKFVGLNCLNDINPLGLPT